MLYTIQAPCEPHTINVVKRIPSVDLVYQCIRGNRGFGGHTDRGGYDEVSEAEKVLNAPSAYGGDIPHKNS